MVDASLDQNPNICEPGSCNQKISDRKKSNKIVPLVASVAGIFVLLVLVSGAAIICALIKKRKPQGNAVSNYHLLSLVNQLLITL